MQCNDHLYAVSPFYICFLPDVNKKSVPRHDKPGPPRTFHHTLGALIVTTFLPQELRGPYTARRPQLQLLLLSV